MVKRKVSGEMDGPFEMMKRKKVAITSSEEKGKIDFSNSTKVMESLLGDIKLDNFFETYWEKKPLVVKRNESTFYGTLFGLSTMKEVLQNNELDFLSDVNVCRYVNGEKELLNEDGQITSKDVDRLMDEKKATFQFHHPQRYVDDLWNLLEKMETYFGSLVGSNIYITPPDSQGLAPHCDDVEIFVLQLEGKKEWKLYKPMVELSRDYTQDLLQESIGEPIIEVLLEPGDMLYFPRGYIHQCKSMGTSHSTHISISTYQQNTWGDFMNHAVTQAIENALEDDVSIRSGLPINYMSMLGTGKNISQYIEDEGDKKSPQSNLSLDKVKEFKKTVQSHLAKLVDHIDVNTAADAMCADFMASRLPPFGYTPKEMDDEEESLPKISDKIKIRYPDHTRVIYNDDDEDGNDDDFDDDSEGEDMEDDEKPAKSKDLKLKSPKSAKKVSKILEGDEDDDDDDAEVPDVEQHVKIMHSLDNNRFSHMGAEVFEEEPGCVKLPVTFAKAMVELLNSEDFVAVSDLVMDEEEDKLTLASTLVANDLVEVKSE